LRIESLTNPTGTRKKVGRRGERTRNQIEDSSLNAQSEKRSSSRCYCDSRVQGSEERTDNDDSREN